MNLTCVRSGVNNIFYLFALFLILTLPNSAFSVTVSVEGFEPLSGKTIASARTMALSNALKTAVENAAKGINPTLDAKSLEKLINENPITYIKAYRILDENRIGDDYKIILEANVDSEMLKDKIKGLKVNNLKSPGKPSISIVVLKIPESDPIIKSLPLSEIKSEITRVLQGGGYKVQESMGDIRIETYVSVKTSESKVGRSMCYALGNVLIKVKDKNEKVLNEVSDSLYLNGTDITQLSLEAIKQAGAKAADKVKLEFDKKWNIGQRVKSKTILITFVGFSNYKQYELLDTILANSTPGIDNITKRIFRNDGVSFLVLSSISEEDLAKTVDSQNTPGFSLRLNEVSSDRIEFSVVTE
ncbi:MAG TPA: hypothetical protein VI935_08240 [Thermodesulfobacteriota bacterium]|nr:hypothetical protein [Thermodesulfobacteriota bacterium]